MREVEQGLSGARGITARWAAHLLCALLLQACSGGDTHSADPGSGGKLNTGENHGDSCSDGWICNGVCLDEAGESGNRCTNIGGREIVVLAITPAPQRFYFLATVDALEENAHGVFFIQNGASQPMELARVPNSGVRGDIALVGEALFFTNYPPNSDAEFFEFPLGGSPTLISQEDPENLDSGGGMLFSVSVRTNSLRIWDPETRSFETFVTDLSSLANKHQLDDTHVYFNWDPPSDQEGLYRASYDALDNFELVSTERCNIEAITDEALVCRYPGRWIPKVGGEVTPLPQADEAVRVGAIRGQFGYSVDGGDTVNFMALSSPNATPSEIASIYEGDVSTNLKEFVANDSYLWIKPRADIYLVELPVF